MQYPGDGGTASRTGRAQHWRQKPHWYFRANGHREGRTLAVQNEPGEDAGLKYCKMREGGYAQVAERAREQTEIITLRKILEDTIRGRITQNRFTPSRARSTAQETQRR